ncbi:Uma2 family endonuclease [Haliscomenobacter sp.]|uniref:Uma2 family endonuclease n=1 Tax=Haliscomenobacter sp. TaxID=2717303 RepID=UPI003593BD36
MQQRVPQEQEKNEKFQQPEATFPDSDGKPMAESTLQFEWIALIKQGMELAFQERPDVFVAGDLLWYPDKSTDKIRQAPDVMVVVGRPKGYRGSYKQFNEEGIAPQVVFEIMSPRNRPGEMIRKYEFYEEYGVLEYYVYDPHKHTLEVYTRASTDDYWVNAIVHGFTRWKSSILGLEMTWIDKVFTLYQADGTPFLSYTELAEKNRLAETELRRTEKLIQDTQLKTEKLAEKLRSLGIDPDSL